MSIHLSIVNLLVSLGYTRTSGCCHGFSLGWLEACLIDEEDLFDARIKTIVSGGEALVHSIHAVKEKKGNNLTADDHELLDILAFYERLELYQSPELHSLLFNKSLSQCDVEDLSYFGSSDAIKSQGGLVKIHSEPCIYTKKEMIAYFNNLGVVIEDVCAQSKEPLGIILSSHNHSIALTYTSGNGWALMDINQYPSKFFKMNKTNLLVKRIMAGFNESNSPYTAFNVSVFTTGKHLGLLNLKEAFSLFQKSHPLTKEIARREAAGSGLAHLAAQYNQVSIIAELAKHGVDLNKADKIGTTPAYIAAENGHASVIAELAKHQVDLNQAISNGTTLAYIAAQEGHVSVIAELAAHDVDLNQAISNGATPVFIAAQEGHVSVIAEFIKIGVNLNTPYTATVASLKQFALSFGDKIIERMTIFIDQQLALLPTSHPILMTPYHIAFVMGHREIMQLLNTKEEQDHNERLSVSHQLIEQTKNGHDKTIGDGYTFFSSSIKEDVASNGVNQRESSDAYQDSSEKRISSGFSATWD